MASHAGNLVCGELGGKNVAVLQGRVHCYEGYHAREVALPIRVLSLLGARLAILTNASGGLNPAFAPGTIMILTDHLNLLGDNPLRGPNVDAWGPRFPDLSKPYAPELVEIALAAARETCSLNNIVTGTYVCIPGPSLETPAETRYLRAAAAMPSACPRCRRSWSPGTPGMQVLGLAGGRQCQ